MTILRIDVETFSSIDLKTCGMHRYIESPDFEILLFAFAYDNEPVRVIDLTAFEDLPDYIIHDLTDPGVIKTAFNAVFERGTISKHFGITCDPVQWRCTAVHALALGLPGYLEGVAEVLKLEAQKDTKGKALIKYFSVPCKPSKANGQRTRNHPHHEPEKWAEYIEYNRQDVVVEREIAKKLERFPVPAHEWKLWALDQRINDRGVRLDPVLVQAAIECAGLYTERLIAAAKELTGLDNPNSLTQVKAWLAEKGLETPEGLGKDLMPVLMDAAPCDDTRQMLEFRQEMGKTSNSKYDAMARAICSDDRVRGILQFCGANRTWRWAGRNVQMHNLPQNHLDDLALARETLRSGDYEMLELLYGPPPFVLSQLVRTALIPSDGCRFIVSDFSAIEARVIAWLADEHWVLDVFRGHGRIYEATASRMFCIPFETIVKGHENYKYRVPGKVATLACGFGGGVAALEKMDKKKEIPAEQYDSLVKQWRQANPNIRKLWYATEEAAMKAVREKTTVKLAHGVRYRYEAGILFADLPSGHSLAYPQAAIKYDAKFDKDGLVFYAQDDRNQWSQQRTWGGTLVENLIQAIARDCLAESLMRLDKAGYEIVLHVHDEAVLDVPWGTGSVEHVTEIMSRPIDWAPGLPLSAAGFETEFYMKD
ncbi:DNA polymerase [Paenibacillus koleovorans]|uniref:DNA polymerase n=1 Tax=Paenibacillus koleovorans TaxID=121608 RepID=UPI000FD95AF0|nr:DNA polymerase [Paenibacillus koleovorans]